VDPETFEVTFDNVRSRFHPDDWRRLTATFSEATSVQTSWRTDFRVVRPDGDLRWCIGTAAAIYDGAGRVTRLSGVAADITDRKRIEEHQTLLAREVDHRAKNSLAVVQSIVRLTRADGIKDYMAAVEGRIQALSRVHSLLAHSRWEGADVHTLVAEELAPYQIGGADHIVISGPHVAVSAPVAQTLALALHELATNAAKYGALSAKHGRVDLSWDISAGITNLRWKETGGPAATRPERLGLGLQMIKSGLQSHICGQANFDWSKKGLVCTMAVPSVDTKSPARLLPLRNRVDRATPDSQGKPSILLVEDEPLVAMMMNGFLDQLDCHVVGPCNTPFEALAFLKDNAVDGAILDINLGGETVYPVADALVRLGVPFVFVTGYGGESVDSRFSQVKRLEKPVGLESLRETVRELCDALEGRSAPVNLRA
jgi:two-component sensor histidine kinase/CheY-like chemotaxis protein